MGRPDTQEVWSQLDDVIDHVYLYADGKGLRISMTFVDSGGHFTTEVYKECRRRKNKRVFAIKGKGGESIPFIAPPRKVPIEGNKKFTTWLYTIGVDAGKENIMSSLKVQEAGPKFCHFPKDEGKGYDANFFTGLLSERLELTNTRRGNVWAWVKIPGHERNEALDCRNYAMAAFRVLNPDMQAVERRLRQAGATKKAAPAKKKKSRSKTSNSAFDSW
jgi:phage terminase large subunit GpA-like protein